MKCQNLFSGEKEKKYFKMSSAGFLTLDMLSIIRFSDCYLRIKNDNISL